MLTRQKSRKSQRGAAALEFALVAPLLILLVFGITDFGLMFNNSSVFANASRDAARAGSFGALKDDIEAVVTSEVSYLPSIASWDTVVTCRKADNSSCGSEAAYNSGMEAGGTVKVTIIYVHKWLTPSLLGLPNQTSITKVSEMRIE